MSVSHGMESYVALCSHAAPILMMVVTGCVGILVSACVGSRGTKALLLTQLLGSLSSFAFALDQYASQKSLASILFLRFDGFTSFFFMLISLCVLLLFLSVWSEGVSRPWYERDGWILAPFSAAGLMICTAAEHLLLIFLGLELAALPLLFMLHIERHRVGVTGVALKYFFFSAIASVFFLYGMSLFYGGTGSFLLAQARQVIQDGLGGSEMCVLLGVGFMLISLVAKLNVFPFHFLLPDVYKVVPLPVLGFMSTASKVGLFGLLIRMNYQVLAHVSAVRFHVSLVFALVAVPSLILSGFLLLRSMKLSDLLAWSSIGNTAFILLLIATELKTGFRLTPTLSYIAAYVLISWGLIFGIQGLRNYVRVHRKELPHFTGLIHEIPLMTLSTALFFGALAGFPPTLGFSVKWSGLQFLAYGFSPFFLSVALLWSLCSLLGYGRWLVPLFAQEAEGLPIRSRFRRELQAFSPLMWFSMLVLLVWVLKFGLIPTFIGIPGVESAVLAL
jgi:NADH-quinone oxidoreductase subunit N